MMKPMRVRKMKIRCQCLKSMLDSAYTRVVEICGADTEVSLVRVLNGLY
jgi:hypothetical protein